MTVFVDAFSSMPIRDLLQFPVLGSFSWLRRGRSLLLVGLVVYGYLLWLAGFNRSG
jgi:hypothetical protein